MNGDKPDLSSLEVKKSQNMAYDDFLVINELDDDELYLEK